MTWWPFVSWKTHLLMIDARNEKILDLAERERYWRTRAERLIDSNLARAGAISEPTMREAIVSKDPSPAAMISAALAITEIDSSKGN